MKLLLTSDWHLSDKAPVCRTDDFHQSMMSLLKQVVEIANEEDASIVCAGDVFDKWNVSCGLLRETYQILELADKPIHCIPGQHDLPDHSHALFHLSALGVLDATGVVWCGGVDGVHECEWDEPVVFHYVPFGHEILSLDHDVANAYLHILIVHEFIYENLDEQWKKGVGSKAKALMKKFPEYDLILSGDNHQQFVVDGKDGQMLVNPGSLMRRTIAQLDHTPAVFLYDTKDWEVEIIELDVPAADDVISLEHQEKVEVHEQRASLFVKRLKDDYEVGLSFEDNLDAFLKKHKICKPVKQIVLQSLESEE